MTTRAERIRAAAIDLAKDRALTTRALARKVFISDDWARRLIRRLRDEGLIEVVATKPAPKMGPPRKVWGLSIDNSAP